MRELAETRALWESVEREWRSSPLYSFKVVPAVARLVDEEVSASEPLAQPLFVELALAADALLAAESIGELEPDWALIESDAAIALSVRQMLRRRERWAVGYSHLMPVFERQLVRAYRALIASLPESPFEAAGGAQFTVPLASLLEHPAETIQNLMLSIYDDDVFRYDLFHHLRERFTTNLLIASGFPPETNANDVSAKLIMPTMHRCRNGAELARLYLAGTPFERLLNLPLPFRIPEEVRFEHCHVIGGTGHGKTQLLQRMIYADLVAASSGGRSVVVVDSQGDLIQKILRLSLFDPEAENSLADRLILIDPADVEFPPSLNLFEVNTARLEQYGAADRERALNGLIELYETFFGALLGAELTQKQGVIFRYLARLMLSIPGATIHTLMEVMEDGRPYRPHMDALDGSARHFFATEFFHPSFSATKKQILKRLWGVLSTPAFERMFAQRHNKLDLFEAINRGSVILINTAKDLLKTDGSALFGRFFIASLAQAALERAAVPADKRTPTFVYVDEAQEYFDDTIETILSQARKYGVGITLAHQTLDQLSPRLRSAFLSNTSFKCAGGVSSKDARALAPELHTSPEFIECLRRRRAETEFAAWVKHRTPEAIRIDVPLGFLERQPTLSDDALDALIAQNRERYCGTLEEVLQFSPRARSLAPAGDPPPLADQRPEAEPAIPVARAIHATSTRAGGEPREGGKGGPKHRYLQSLVKELGEQQGFRATIEARLPGGQIDVLLEREGVAAAFEISISTGVAHEVENLRKCLRAGYERVALVLQKTGRFHARYEEGVVAELTDAERSRVSILKPEDLPDYISALAPPPPPEETMVRGYKVKVTKTAVSAEESQSRREMVARLVARSMKDGG
jgi:hypothetical protein